MLNADKRKTLSDTQSLLKNLSFLINSLKEIFKRAFGFGFFYIKGLVFILFIYLANVQLIIL